MSIKLSDTQLVMLSAAAQRDDRCLTLLEKLKGAAAHKVATKLIAPRPVEEAALREAVANLAALDLAGLRLQWRNVFGGSAPVHLPKPLLARILAYRLQADVFGDLPDPVRRTLESFGAAQGPARVGQAGGDGSPSRRRIKPGSILVREWDGRLHRVMALEQGFAWDGKTYPSLSQVARAITGGHWNGPKRSSEQAPPQSSAASPLRSITDDPPPRLRAVSFSRELVLSLAAFRPPRKFIRPPETEGAKSGRRNEK